MNIAIIPGRYASSRFPGKMLASDTGMPLIVHVLERASMAQRIDRVLVATDDQRIADAVIAAGWHAMMTSAEHPNGTSRIAEAAEKLRAAGELGETDLIVNVQGDEPEIEPSVIDQLIDRLAAEPPIEAGGAPMATLASDFADDEDPADPNIVKLVLSQGGHAMYFSRSLIPHVRDAGKSPPGVGQDESPHLKHPGLYAYRPSFLPTYVGLRPTPMEQAEMLEQLRVLEHGYRIAVAKTSVRHHGIDTAEQYEAFVTRWKAASG